MTNEHRRDTDTTRRPRPNATPNLPQHPSYIPGYASIPLARFFVDLFVRPTLTGWLLMGCLLDGVALVVAVLVAIGLTQTTGLSWWSLGAGGVVVALVALVALEGVCYRAWRCQVAP